MKIKSNAPTLEESKQLYELAARLKALAPWEWMEEAEIFGVQNPETNEIGFVSVMGNLGEHLALGVYLGTEGLYGFWDFQNGKYETEPLALFDLPQLQVSFEDREQLKENDRTLIKKLGLKFRGRQNYPLFRGTKPGFMPWFITSEDARFLIHIIEQSLDVASRVKDNPLVLTIENNPGDEIYLIRAAEKQNGNLVWHDEFKRIPPPETKQYQVEVPPEILNHLKAFPQNKNLIFEMDLFHAPTPVAEKGERPFFPKMLMAAETNSRLILGFELIKPREDALESRAEIVESSMAILSSHNVLPKEIRVGSDLLFNLLRNFTQQLNIELRQTDNLLAIREAKEAMFGFFGSSLF